MSSRAPNINRSRIHEDMVQMLAVDKLDGADRALFPTIRELLCFAAMLGYSEKRRIPLDRSDGVEDVSYQQFERGDAEDLIYLLALADSRDPEILRDGEESRCAEIFEEYANGGLTILQDVLLKSGGEHPDKEIMAFLNDKKYLMPDEKDADLTKVTF
ncbi:MAG: dnd system-associated protein 4 [Parasphingorhabdus sp.]|jgi:dnd system-associated protein 4|uniref:DNA phosphorothioation-associated protein 4 n=1 Tax=Parasphingorhabdus sp. TaxID=2709688 RepID=UPI0039E31B13